MTATAEKAEQTQPVAVPDQPLNLEQGGKGWRPKKGSEVRGILRSVGKGWSDWDFDWYPILTIEQDDGSLVAVHCFHAVLLNRVMALKPRRGEYVGVKCHGTEKTTDGKRTVVLYSFDVSRPGADDSDPYSGFESMARAKAAGNEADEPAEA